MPNRSFVMHAGHLGQSPECKYGKSGTAYCNFSLAVSTGKDDRKKTTWHSCIAFGDYAEFMGEAEKGQAAVVVGREEDEEWEKDGQKIVTKKVICDLAVPIPRRKSKPKSKEPERRYQSDPGYEPPPSEGEIPF